MNEKNQNSGETKKKMILYEIMGEKVNMCFGEERSERRKANQWVNEDQQRRRQIILRQRQPCRMALGRCRVIRLRIEI